MTDFSEVNECFSGELTISTISGRHEAVKSLIEQSKAHDVDLMGIEKIDIAGIQLIVALEKYLKKSDIKKRIIYKNRYTIDAMQSCGIVA